MLKSPSLLALFGLLACSLGVVAPSVSAQESLWTDDPTLRPGRLVVGFAGGFQFFDERFTPGGDSESLGTPLELALSGAALPGRASVDEGLARLFPGSGFSLTGGSVRWPVNGSVRRLPFTFSLGVLDRLTVGAEVPVIRKRIEGQLVIDPSGANSGASPGVTEPTVPAAFLENLGAAVTNGRQAWVDQCGSGGGNCAELDAALDRAELFLGTLESAYAVPVFPTAESDLGMALATTLEETASVLSQLGVAGVPTTMPFADGPLSPTAFSSLFLDPLYGTDGPPGTRLETPWELGDVTLFAHFLLLDIRPNHGPAPTPDGEDAAGEADPYPAGLHARVVATGRYTLGTGTPDTLTTFLDFGDRTGTSTFGAGVELFAAAGRWIGRLSGGFTSGGKAEVARAHLFRDQLLVNDPSEIGKTLFERETGSRIAFEAGARYRLAPELSAGPWYRWSRRGADEWKRIPLDDTPGDELPIDPAIPASWSAESEQSLQELGVELRYRAHPAGRVEEGWPLDGWFRWQQAIAGSGARTPKGSMVEAGIRLYIDLWGGS